MSLIVPLILMEHLPRELSSENVFESCRAKFANEILMPFDWFHDVVHGGVIESISKMRSRIVQQVS